MNAIVPVENRFTLTSRHPRTFTARLLDHYGNPCIIVKCECRHRDTAQRLQEAIRKVILDDLEDSLR